MFNSLLHDSAKVLRDKLFVFSAVGTVRTHCSGQSFEEEEWEILTHSRYSAREEADAFRTHTLLCLVAMANVRQLLSYEGLFSLLNFYDYLTCMDVLFR